MIQRMPIHKLTQILYSQKCSRTKHILWTTSSLLNRMIVHQLQQVITSPASLAAPGIDGSFLSQGLWSSQEDLWTQQPQAVPGGTCLTWHFGGWEWKMWKVSGKSGQTRVFCFLTMSLQPTRSERNNAQSGSMIAGECIYIIWMHIVICYFFKVVF